MKTSWPLPAHWWLAVELQAEAGGEIKNERKNNKKQLLCLFQLCFYSEAPARRGWLGSFAAPKSTFRTPWRIFKGASGNIFPAPLYKMTRIYYSCRAWWCCWSIPVTQQLVCQLLRFLPFNIYSLCLYNQTAHFSSEGLKHCPSSCLHVCLHPQPSKCGEVNGINDGCALVKQRLMNHGVISSSLQVVAF